MPYALSALSDPSVMVQQAALKILDDLGLQWEEEHKNDLKVSNSDCTHIYVPRHLQQSWQSLCCSACMNLM